MVKFYSWSYRAKRESRDRKRGDDDSISKKLCGGCFAHFLCGDSRHVEGAKNSSSGQLTAGVSVRLRPHKRGGPAQLRIEARGGEKCRPGRALLPDRSSQGNTDVGCRRNSGQCVPWG